MAPYGALMAPYGVLVAPYGALMEPIWQQQPCSRAACSHCRGHRNAIGPSGEIRRGRRRQDFKVLYESFLFVQKCKKKRNIRKIEQKRKFFYFALFSVCFGLFPTGFRWCGICVIEKNGKYHMVLVPPLKASPGPWQN